MKWFVSIKWYWIIAGLVVFNWGKHAYAFHRWPTFFISLGVWLIFFTLLDLQSRKDNDRRTTNRS